MRKVGDLLSRKGGVTIAVRPDTTVIDAIRLMADKNIGSVVVSDDSENFVGIVTERDYTRKIVLHGRSSTETKVKEIMTTDLPRVSPHDTIEHCMELMTEKFVRYIPVFSGEKMVGIVSMSDAVHETIIAQQETIDHLKNYIAL